MVDPQFWVLRPDKSRRATLDSKRIKVRHITCPENPEHNATRGLLGPLSVVLVSRHVGDFVWTWLSDLLVAERARAFLRAHKLTGYRLTKAGVRFRNVKYGPPPPMWQFRVTGWAGTAAVESGIQLANSCSACGLLEYSMRSCSHVVDPRQWDGSDFFMVWPMPLYIFLSNRAATLLRQAKFKGVALLPAQELEHDSRILLSPGRLSNHMPLKRARELGEKLGIV